MAYTKTTWNNLSSPPINAENLNKIEQGIYNNSLGIDKINPSGTATVTAEIEEGQLSDVIGFKSLKLKGQTSQYTTTGKNILPQDKYIATQTTNGITYTNNGDGTFNLTGTATANTTIVIVPVGNIELEANQAYYLYSSVPYNSTTFNLTVAMSVDGANKYILANNTHTPTATPTNIRFQFYIGSGQSINQTNIKAMLVKGSTAPTTYEKYTGGKASPNPDYPQDVNIVSGDNVIAINSKNIANPNDTFAGYPVGSNGSTITYTASANTTTYKKACYIEANQQYTLSWKINTPKSTGNRDIKIADKNGKQLYNISYSNTNNVRTKTFTSPYSGYAYIALDANATELQVEKGSTATTYTAHQGNNFDIDLPVENKLPYPYVDTTKTNNGITYTDLGDGRIKVNGTATANSAFALYGTASSQITLNANYVYGGVNSNVRVRVMNRSSSGTYTTLGNSIGTSTKIDRSTASTGYVEISIASGTTVNNLIITPMLSDNEVNAFTPYNENPIELCKISTYQDYIYKKDGKWWKHKAIGKIVLDGKETWSFRESLTTVSRFSTIDGIISSKPSSPCFCDRLKWYANQATNEDFAVGDNEAIHIRGSATGIGIKINTTIASSVAQLQTWLETHNLNVYYILNVPIDEEITYTPLIRQLDELYNSGLYDVTNISQDNSSEAFILDIEACKNNINGIVEYIRR